MEINIKLLKKIQSSKSSILVVTKSLNVEDTEKISSFMMENYSGIFFGIGENRVEALSEKNIQRELAHFIGNIQTKQIKHIVDFSLTIHSLDNIKYAKKINELCTLKNTWVRVFIQINVDKSKEGGIHPNELAEFLTVLDTMENIGVMGISAMGSSSFTRAEKEAEFELLLDLRKKYLPNGLISAGTSLDYEIALEKGIDIVRIGTKLYSDKV